MSDLFSALALLSAAGFLSPTSTVTLRNGSVVASDPVLGEMSVSYLTRA